MTSVTPNNNPARLHNELTRSEHNPQETVNALAVRVRIFSFEAWNYAPARYCDETSAEAVYDIIWNGFAQEMTTVDAGEQPLRQSESVITVK